MLSDLFFFLVGDNASIGIVDIFIILETFL